MKFSLGLPPTNVTVALCPLVYDLLTSTDTVPNLLHFNHGHTSRPLLGKNVDTSSDSMLAGCASSTTTVSFFRASANKAYSLKKTDDWNGPNTVDAPSYL